MRSTALCMKGARIESLCLRHSGFTGFTTATSTRELSTAVTGIDVGFGT